MHVIAMIEIAIGIGRLYYSPGGLNAVSGWTPSGGTIPRLLFEIVTYNSPSAPSFYMRPDDSGPYEKVQLSAFDPFTR